MAVTKKSENSQLVQMRLKRNTISQVDDLQTLFNSPNRTDVVKTSIALASMIAQAMREGQSVFLESKAGKRERIVIPGLGKS